MLYTSKDVTNLLGIGKNQLSYLVKTRIIMPYEKVRGRGKVHKFSLENLVQLAVIKELVNSGIELSFIEQLIESTNIFDLLKEGPSEIFLLVYKSINGITIKTVREFLDLEGDQVPRVYLTINLYEIMKEIEEKTGERFWRKGG